jgi:ubiquinone biosynthesis protein
VARNQNVALGEMQVGRAFLEMARHSGETGVRVPPELTMLGKALLNLDGIGRLLAPQFDPNAAIRDDSTRIMNQRMLKSLSPANVFATALEMKDLVERLPSRVNRILDAAANNQLALKVDTGIKPAELMVGLQKVANRITVGLVIAAMIVGAAMMMRIPTRYTIFGYPWLAMIFLLMAGTAAAIMLFNTFIKDHLFSRKAKQEIKQEL